MPEAVFASPADAAAMLGASLDHLAGTDWASLGTAAHGEMLTQLQSFPRSPPSAGTSRTGTGPRGHGWSTGPGWAKVRPAARSAGKGASPATARSPP
jgi:hypothetical protein